MKTAILALTVMLITLTPPSHAEVVKSSTGNYPLVGNSTHTTAIREHVHEVEVHEKTVDRYERFDWGAYLNAILLETENSEWGLLGTHLVETNETRAMVGGKIYFNRMFWQKK